MWYRHVFQCLAHVPGLFIDAGGWAVQAVGPCSACTPGVSVCKPHPSHPSHGALLEGSGHKRGRFGC
jgi:hypothetical protein